MARPTEAELAGLQRLKEEFPGHTVTIERGVAVLTPENSTLTPEQRAKQERANAMARRAEILGVFDAA